MSQTLLRHGVALPSLLFFTGFLGYLMSLILPLMIAAVAADIGAEVTAIGSLVGVQSIVVALTSVVVGPLADRYGVTRLLPVLLILNGLALVAFAQAQSVPALYVTGTLSAMAFGPLAFCAFAYIGDAMAQPTRPAFVGLVSGSLYGCVVLGVPLTVFLMEGVGLGWRMAVLPFAVLSLGCGAAAPLVFRGNSPTPVDTAPRSTVAGVLTTYRSFLRKPELLGLLAIFLVMRIGVGIYFTYGTAYLLAAREFPAEGLMWVYTAGGLLAFLASLQSQRVLRLLGSRGAILIASAALICSILLIIYFPTSKRDIVFWIGVFSTLYMISEAIRMAALHNIAIGKVDTGMRGAFLGCINLAIHLGTAAGALMASLLLGHMARDAGSSSSSLGQAYVLMVQITAVLWAVAAGLSITFCRDSIGAAFARRPVR